jgi:3-polyprenyl-4-hydroxybenzoate decarboxylase
LQRSDAVFMAVAPNNSAEHLLLSGLPKQARISRAVMDFTHLPAVEDINWPVWATHFVCFISLRENVSGRGLAKQMGTLLLGLDHYVKVLVLLPSGTDLSNPLEVLGAVAERCDFHLGSGIDTLGNVYSHLLDPSSRTAGLSSKMIIDATSPRIPVSSGDLERVKRIPVVDNAAYPYGGSPVLCAVVPRWDVEGFDWVLREEALAGSRLVILVDEDIDVGEGRQLLWAVATRLQPVEDSLCGGGRLVLDARKGEEWTARRATLPFN